MMKVPRPNCGVTVLTPDNRAGRIVSVDWCDTSVLVDCSGKGYDLKITDYNPAATWDNFMRACGEWDYHYRASDDPGLYEEGKEYEQALVELFKALPDEDKFFCRKIVDVVVMSTMRRAGDPPVV